MNKIVDYGVKALHERMDRKCVNGKIGGSERVLSVVAGAFIVGFGLKYITRKPLLALSGLSSGGALVYRGLTGRCVIKAEFDKADKEKREEIEFLERRYIVK